MPCSTATWISVAAALTLTLASGCMEHAVKPVELNPDGSDHTPWCPIHAITGVDILFVIDNSGSMGEEQAILANNFGAFIEVLETASVGIDYRVAVTTTDNGNPWCPPELTTPEAGNLVMSSCKDRIGDFSLAGGGTDMSDIACNDICQLDADALEILPTTTHLDQNPAPRPWLEKIHGQQNLPASTDMSEAFKCFGPQGINGCGFESPLESMYLGLIRAQTATEPAYGFLRSEAMLAVVFVTDEADCSYNKAFSQVFEQDGERVFWSDPTLPFPTSAVCWNAGVSCSGDPSGYDSCEATNKDAAGNEGVSDEQAVLHPMRRYVGLLDGIEQDKQQLHADNEIMVALIGGVDADGVATYADATQTNPDFQQTFGIGPGCEAANPHDPSAPIQAVPPVRLRELVDTFTPGNLFSICEPQYTGALTQIAKAIEAQVLPSCFVLCVRDTDETTAKVDAACTVEQRVSGSGPASTRRIPECLRAGEGYAIDGETGEYSMPSDAADVCYAMLTDIAGSPATATTSDDMSHFCADSHYNLEIEVVRRPGSPAPAGAWISAVCELADFPEISCPGIGS